MGWVFFYEWDVAHHGTSVGLPSQSLSEYPSCPLLPWPFVVQLADRLIAKMKRDNTQINIQDACNIPNDDFLIICRCTCSIKYF